MALPRFPALRVIRAERRGSSLPVLVETASGLLLTKLRGAAQGTPALIAEIVVAELAEALGLPVPERVLVELAPETPSDDRNDELSDLLARSRGENLGFRFLPGAVEPSARELEGVDDAFAIALLWLDGLVMNPDRTARNPNLLFWRRQPWLIDHGAALPFQYDWASVTEDSPREPGLPAAHLFAGRAALLARHDAALARQAFLWKRAKAPRPFVPAELV